MTPALMLLAGDSPMPDIPLAHDWWGIASLSIITLGAVAALLVYRDLKAVKHQVKNSHEENLRDDLDNKFAGMGAKQDLILSILEDHSDRINSIEVHLRDRSA